MPDVGSIQLMGVNGRTLLLTGLVVCVLGLAFGLVIFRRIKNLPVHASMRDISELIYETCKTYLVTQGKFILILEIFIGLVILLYFGVLLRLEPMRVLIILLFSLIGIGGSYGVAWFGMRINTFANSRTAFASLAGRPLPVYCHPARVRDEHRDAAHQRRALHHAVHPPLRPRGVRGAVLHRLRDRRVPRRGGAPDRRRDLHEDCGHRLGSHEDRVQHQGGRRAEPGRHRRLYG